MKIVDDYPPNYEQIAAKFNIRGLMGVVFAYGNILYNPSGDDIPDHLMEHEKTHSKQQKAMGTEAWWDRYLVDTDFRLSQEVEAYRIQYAYLKEHYSRSIHRIALNSIATDLSGPMYGYVVSKKEAKVLVSTEL